MVDINTTVDKSWSALVDFESWIQWNSFIPVVKGEFKRGWWVMSDFPDKIKSLIDEEKYYIDDVGMSDSTVVLFLDKILKIQTISEESENEYHVMEWLQDKLPAPIVLGFERDEKRPIS